MFKKFKIHLPVGGSKFKNINKYISFLFIIIISLIPLLDLFHPGLPITHDGQDHVARIANFYNSLTEGNVVPRWAANLNWGYGHPILMFLYPLSSYISSIFIFLGFSLIDSIKIEFGLVYVLSGIAMFLWVRKFLGDIPGFVAGILYLYAPYRFVDLYVRGAIGEHTAFIFLPLILYFLLKLSIRNSPWYLLGGSLSLTGLLLSHNAISIMFLPFIIFYAFYLIVQNEDRKRTIKQYIFTSILGFGLSSFFLLPAFFEGKYTLRDIVTGNNEYASRFINFFDIIKTSWSYGGTGQLSVQIGMVHVLLILISMVLILKLFKRKEKNNFILYIVLLIYLLFSIFIMVQASDFVWKQVSILQKFQFPWRFLSVTVFASSVLGCYVFYLIKNKTLKVLLLLIFMLTAFFVYKSYWKVLNYSYKPESFYQGIYYGTTDTGESAPIWSVRFMEKEAKARAEIIEGKAVIRELKRSTTYRKYEIDAISSQARVRENTLFFPGWKVYVNGKLTDIQFQDPHSRGLITFYINQGRQNIEIKFEDTKLRKIADYISLLSVLIIVGWSIISLKKKYAT